MRSRALALSCLIALSFQTLAVAAAGSRSRIGESYLPVASSMLLPATSGGQEPKAAASSSPTQTTDEAAAAEILDKYVAAIGGRDVLKSNKNVEEQVEQEVFGSTNKVYSIRETTGLRRFYARAEGPNGTIETGFDGKRVWQKTPFFRGYLSESDRQARAALRSGSQHPLWDYKNSGKKYVRRANETIDGKEYLVVATTETNPFDEQVPVKYYFDPATYLLRRSVIGDQIKNTVTVEDYRKVEGRMVPFTQVTTNPQATIKRTTKSIKYDVPVDDARFEYGDGSANAKADAAAASTTRLGEVTTSSADAETKPAVTTRPAESNTTRPAKRFAAEEVIPEELRTETFEFVWKTVNDTYWDKSFNGVNWQSVHDKYASMVKPAQKSEDFHRLLDQMLGELKESHFKIIPPDRVRTLGSRMDDVQPGGIGIDLRWVDRQLLVTELRKDFPAAAAGIRKGFVVTKINGKTPDQLFEEFQKKNPGFHAKEGLVRVRAAGQELAGKANTQIKLEVLDDKDKLVVVELTRKAVPLGNALEFESRKLEGNIGYLTFNVFIGDAVAKFQAALREFHDSKAVIIDLRGNPGGVGSMAATMANSIFSGAGSLGVSRFRYETQQFSYKGSGRDAYMGKIVIVVDENSVSTSEVFAGGLQENGRVTVVGTTTAGAVLPSLQSILPTGGVLQHVISDFKTPKGIVLEGRGVIPDIVARPTRAALLGGHDVAFERAVEFISPVSSKQ